MTIQAKQQLTFIYTYDLDGSARFLSDVLGLEQVLDQGACRIFRVAGTAFLGVCARENRHKEPNGIVYSFVVDDVNATCRALADKGVILEAPPAYSEQFKVYSAFFRDPNGYMFEVQSFADPDWPEP
ncbi:MAG: VOC family protein [Alphaproteobacteria bacterium]|nr:VOC family protein [Alphaproteobacteria bacterium]